MKKTLEGFIKSECAKIDRQIADKSKPRWARRKLNIRKGYALWLLREYKRQCKEEDSVRRDNTLR